MSITLKISNKDEKDRLNIVKETIRDNLKEQYDILSMSKRGKLIYCVLKDKNTKVIIGSKFVIGSRYNNFEQEYMYNIEQKTENTYWNRLFVLKELLPLTENESYHWNDYQVRLRSVSEANKKIREEQLNIYDNIKTNKRKRVKPGSILKFDTEVKFTSGFKYDKFKFVKNDKFVLPDEPIDTERTFVIHKFRNRSFDIIKDGDSF